MGRIEGRSIVMGETKNGMSNRWIKRNGTSYGQWPGIWAESRIDELFWERKLEERCTTSIYVKMVIGNA